MKETVKANCTRDKRSAVHTVSWFPFPDAQRERLTFARSTSWVARPSSTAFIMYMPK